MKHAKCSKVQIMKNSVLTGNVMDDSDSYNMILYLGKGY